MLSFTTIWIRSCLQPDDSARDLFYGETDFVQEQSQAVDLQPEWLNIRLSSLQAVRVGVKNSVFFTRTFRQNARPLFLYRQNLWARRVKWMYCLTVILS
ncbi:hypothetical protein BV494_01340 [Rahnella sikkimica]|uniref:Uncharacterized protein n=1 Tax=Rahnella sikkimica TaxID=1805933 RepID=A0A2L1ULD7_9GAMM|nr:hypothetical protein BV494_01340 [Rahnella sikkimica]